MKRVALIVLLALLALAAPTRANGHYDRAATALALRSSVALFDADQAEAGRSYCSGVAIGERLVLTAAHCVSGKHFVDRILVATYSDGNSYPLVAGVRRVLFRQGWDLAVLEVDESLNARIPNISVDIAPGDRLIMVGSMDGEEFTVSPMTLSKLYPDLAFGVCNPEEDVYGTEKHQVIAAVGFVWGGNSGGGVFDREGNLVGITTNMHVLGSFECVKEEGKPPRVVALWVAGPLWAWIVGPNTLTEFLNK